MSAQPSDVARRKHTYFPQRHYRPGDPLPPSHIKVDAMETLRRNAEAYEVYLRDEAARMERTGRRAA